MTPEERIERALELAEYGSIDGAHHKMWVIDQMVRALTGCPMLTIDAIDANGHPYTYEDQGESEEYRAWVAAHRDGDAGPHSYPWDTGVIP